MIEILTDLPETPEMLERVLTAAAEAALRRCPAADWPSPSF